MSDNSANNGERVGVRFANFRGFAGKQIRNGKTFLAFSPQTSAPIGKACLVGDRAHKIVGVEHSPNIVGMVVVEVEDIEDESLPPRGQ